MNMSTSIRKRNISIDILKFLAVILIINSHMDACYPPKYSILATGGAIGVMFYSYLLRDLRCLWGVWLISLIGISEG